MRIHIHVANVRFNCALPACNKSFKKFSAFKTHCYRHKEGKSKLKSMPFTSFELTCHVDSCQVRCETLSRFYQHLKTHIREGRSVSCPFQQCDKSFSVVSTFTAHVSRKHSDCSEVNLIDSVALPHGMHECSEQHHEMSQDFLCSDTDGVEQDTFGESVDEDQFLRHLALFYLKLQSKCLIPSSTVQIIVDHLQEIHEMSHSHLLFKLREKLSALEVAEADINAIFEILQSENLFQTCNSQKLKTDQKRKTFFKNTFNYVAPVPLCLGTNEAGKECFSQYVSIKETIGSLLQIDTVTEHRKQVFSGVRPHDVWDGSNLKGNELLNTDASSFSLILYQDALEVANPLGSGRKKHKLLCVYATLADIPPHHRSRIDQMQLVLLCREQDFKYFGQDKVFSPLIKDLKDIEVSGITLPDGKVYRGTLSAICGDNLGSHGIGGFVENFTKSVNFCRYCNIDRETFKKDPLFKVSKRTVQSYKDLVQSQTSDATSNATGGVKFDSVFNGLRYFHVCQPGLPPCLGHDIFEGVASYDLALYINRLVTVEKLFTYQELNRRINHLTYLGNDAKQQTQ